MGADTLLLFAGSRLGGAGGSVRVCERTRYHYYMHCWGAMNANQLHYKKDPGFASIAIIGRLITGEVEACLPAAQRTESNVAPGGTKHSGFSHPFIQAGTSAFLFARRAR